MRIEWTKYFAIGVLSTGVLIALTNVSRVTNIEPFWLQVVVTGGVGAFLGLLIGLTVSLLRRRRRRESIN